jgi:hypothetical protein
MFSESKRRSFSTTVFRSALRPEKRIDFQEKISSADGIDCAAPALLTVTEEAFAA